MATTNFVDNSTLIEAAWLDDVDTFAYGGLTSVSGTDTITATGPASMTVYATNQLFRFVAAATNTGATTINITPSGGAALGAKNIFFNGAACAGGEIRSGRPCVIIYDGTQFNLIGPFAGGTVAGAVTFSSALTISGASVTVGTNPASTGVVRIPNATYITARNAANDGNVAFIGVNASDVVEVGGGNACVISGTLSIGSNYATTGPIRIANNAFLYARNAANSGDVGIIGIDTSDLVNVGGGNSVIIGGAFRASSGVRVGADSTNNLLDDASTGAGTATLYIGNASINVTSDENLKSNIRPLEDGLSIIRALQPIEYDQDKERPWGDVRHYVGFGARHTHKFAPWSVNTQGDTGLPWKMRQEFLMAPAVRALQQLEERILKLEKRHANS